MMDQKFNSPEESPFDGKPIGLSREEKQTLFILLTKIGFDWSRNLFMGTTLDCTDLAGSDRTDLACNVSGAADAPDAVPVFESADACDDMPTLPDSVFASLPVLLQKVVAATSTKKERDCMLLVSMVTISSCLHRVSALYDGKVVYPNLFLYITAPASAGKGRMDYAMELVEPVHQDLLRKAVRLMEEYENKLEEYKRHRALDPSLRKPVMPPDLMLQIPGNNSATGLFQMLAENDGIGLIFETEGDAMSGFKADNKVLTMGLRKAYHHEKISYNRRTKREHVEILMARLSVVLTATPGQLADLIPNAENGLFSRFMFYYMSQLGDWKDVFLDNKNQGLAAYFKQLGKEFHSFYKKLQQSAQVSFSYSRDQQKAFNAFFARLQKKYQGLYGPDFTATIRRMGIITYRLSMIFTALRMADTHDFSKDQPCAEVDFQAALAIATVLIDHSAHVFNELLELNAHHGKSAPAVSPLPEVNKMSKFLAKLPARFSAQYFKALAASMSISERSAKRYIVHLCAKGLVAREDYGMYTNLTISPPESDQN